MLNAQEKSTEDTLSVVSVDTELANPIECARDIAEVRGYYAFHLAYRQYPRCHQANKPVFAGSLACSPMASPPPETGSS